MFKQTLSFLFAFVFGVLLVTGVSSCKNGKNTLFTSLPSSQTNITFTNTLEKHKLFNILYYLYYYNGGGVAAGDINNDGLPDIYFTANSKGNNVCITQRG